jgi:hypothetical protein
VHGLVYPRDTWWLRLGLRLENIYFVETLSYQSFIHSGQSVGLLKAKASGE